MSRAGGTMAVALSTLWALPAAGFIVFGVLLFVSAPSGQERAGRYSNGLIGVVESRGHPPVLRERFEPGAGGPASAS